MNAAIVGLGLIGGSLCKAYQEEGWTVWGLDRDTAVTDFAVLSGAVDAPLTDENLGSADLLLIAIPPRAAVEYLEAAAPKIGGDTLVIDCCGVKGRICEAGFRLAAQYGFTYVGGHPMAGTHNAGFKHSREDLFRGASMVLVPPRFDDIALLDRLKALLSPAGFGHFSVTTAERHDAVIAFTSQLAHVVSNAYMKSPAAKAHRGFSAGSYRDLTRVARLNPDMWAELFLENQKPLLSELDTLIAALGQYRAALADEDFDTLRALLDEGSRIKKEVDG